MRYFSKKPRKDVSPVDVDRVHVVLAELGHLEIVLLDILLVLKVAPAIGDNSSPVSNADKVGRVALQLEHSVTFLIWTDPSLAEVNDVRFE